MSFRNPPRIAELLKRPPQMGNDEPILVNLSGRGDKDVAQVAEKVYLPTST